MIGRGTTPTIRFTLNIVNPQEIAYAIMTIAEYGKTIIEKEFDAATIGENYIEWNLSQSETLSLGEEGNVEIQARYRTGAGLAYKSPCHRVPVDKLLHEGVI